MVQDQDKVSEMSNSWTEIGDRDCTSEKVNTPNTVGNEGADILDISSKTGLVCRMTALLQDDA
jgi:hypothetical protein